MGWTEDVIKERKREEQARREQESREREKRAIYQQALDRANPPLTSMLEQSNQDYLDGKGSVWSGPSDWDPYAYVWELWWTKERQTKGPYIYATLLLSSLDVPYVKIYDREISINQRLEQQLADGLKQALGHPIPYEQREYELPSLIGDEVNDTPEEAMGELTLHPEVPRPAPTVPQDTAVAEPIHGVEVDTTGDELARDHGSPIEGHPRKPTDWSQVSETEQPQEG